MGRYQPVPLPTGAAEASAADIAAGVTGWIRATPLADLVAAFGGDLPAGLSTDELLDWLDAFSAEHWDFRRRHGAAERDEVTGTRFPAGVVRTVAAAAEALGLATPRPVPLPRYHHLLVLGGLARSCLHRTAYAAHLVTSGTVRVDEVAALGSYRPLRPAELDALRPVPAGPVASGRLVDAERLTGGYEVDAMDAGIRAGFGFTEPAQRHGSTGEITHHSWSVAIYRPAAGPVVRVLAAPSTEPDTRRAHTSDTYHFWAGLLRPAAGERVLVLTSQPYVPFQHCDAVRTLRLGYGCHVDTVGLDPTLIGEGPARPYGTDQYLQEIRSTIRSMAKLYRAIR